MLLNRLILTGILTFIPFSTALAADALDYGDTAWLIVSTALVIVYVTKFVTGGLRVESDSEIEGLDNSLHGERAFEIN